MPENFKFEIGSTYENMKGEFEVISIHKNSMVIRWGNGSEVTTTIDLQTRILERMAFEKAVMEQKNNSKPKKKSVKGKKKPAPSDE